MAIKITCSCGKRLAIEPQFVGKKIACPQCQKRFVLTKEKIAALVKRARARRAALETNDADSAPVDDLGLTAALDPAPASLDDEIGPSADDGVLTLLVEDAVSARSTAAPIQSAQTPNDDRPRPLIAPVRGQTGWIDRQMTQSGVERGDEKLDGLTCPSCGQTYPARAKLCVQCGIDLKTGRGIITSADGHLDGAYVAAERVISIISWVLGIGIYPIASEAFGTRKPHFIRATAVVTVLVTAWFWAYEWTDSPKMQSMKQLMLWCGGKVPDGERLMLLYALTPLGDEAAFDRELTRRVRRAMAEAEENETPKTSTVGKPTLDGLLNAAMQEAKRQAVSQARRENADRGKTAQGGGSEAEESGSEEDDEPLPDTEEVWDLQLKLAPEAHLALPVEQRCIGQYRFHQLLTNAMLHGGILHLVGNMLFLIVFGCRVNALIGNKWTAVVYPLLAIIGSASHMMASTGREQHAALGASGAIMGMAGMYLVLFPVHQIHMAAWWRWGLANMFRLSLKVWPVRGFWVVLFYIAFDVGYTLFDVEDGVAHWAHLGGFIGGMVLAMILLCARQINARGADLLSMVLGKHAWALVGKPRMN